MEFGKYLEKTAKQLDRELEKILKEQLKEAGKTDKKLVPLLETFAKSCQGGKRIRGVLVILGYWIGSNVILSETKDLSLASLSRRSGRMRGTSNKLRDSSLIVQNDIYKVAAAFEIFHSGVLAHDDIIDQSLLRRSKPSLHQVLGGDHYGISQAISLADYGFFLSFKIISESNFPQENKIKALELFSKVMLDTALGEMLDLEEADPLVVMKLKTAYYTISGPLQMGAILGGLGPTSPRLRGMKDFGENLGIAFQIKDDILDSEVDFWGGIDNAKKEAEKFKNKAMKILPEITKDPQMSKILEQMAEYLVQRKK